MFLKEFREFIARGNVIDMAVGIIIGGAFGTIVNSLVNDIIMPPIGLLLNSVNFNDLFLLLADGDPSGPYVTLDAAKEAGAVTLNYGLFINAIISFLIIALVVFMLVRTVNNVKRDWEEKQKTEEKESPTTKECPHCLSDIPVAAKRCKFCTSDV